MVAITAGDVSSPIVGDVYCSVIEGCHEIFDLRRAQEWTTALAEWCASQPDLVPYQGSCLVHRAQILQLHGAWDEAMAEARQARERFSNPPGQRAIGGALLPVGRPVSSHRQLSRGGTGLPRGGSSRIPAGAGPGSAQAGPRR